MLGSAFLDLLISQDDFDIYTYGRKKTSKVIDSQQYSINNLGTSGSENIVKVDFIIHCAANTDLNDCEKNVRQAISINVKFVESLNQFANVNTHLFYISTDSVFDGIEGNYDEHARTNPLNNYAKTKLKGEVRSKNKFIGSSTIVRTNIFGFSKPVKNSLVEWALKEWKMNHAINGFSNFYFNAIYISQLAEIVNELIVKNVKFEYLNVASSDFISKYDFLNLLREEFGYSSDLLKTLIYIQGNQTLKRPLDTTLNIELLSSVMNVPSIQSGIKQLKLDWDKSYENQ